MSTFIDLLPRDYGYVLAVLGSSFFMNIYLTLNVSSARKKYNVQYPDLYAAPSNKHAFEFNSVQRAHQNTLECYSIVMLQMCLCGLVHPLTSAVFGGIWVVGRFVYGYGYSKGGPQGRTIGAVLSHIGDIPLAVMPLKIAFDMLTK